MAKTIYRWIAVAVGFALLWFAWSASGRYEDLNYKRTNAVGYLHQEALRLKLEGETWEVDDYQYGHVTIGCLAGTGGYYGRYHDRYYDRRLFLPVKWRNERKIENVLHKPFTIVVKQPKTVNVRFLADEPEIWDLLELVPQ